jgi:uncharacterized damage-inducible protein DinB
VRPQLEADLAVLEEILADLSELIRPLDEKALNWSPLSDGTNSIAVLVVHTVGSTKAWLARAVGEEAPRDRDAEFRARGSAGSLLALVEECGVDARIRAAQLEQLDLTRLRPVHRLRGDVDAEVTAAWCVEHSLAHASEHWGQIQLTAQLFAARSPR